MTIHATHPVTAGIRLAVGRNDTRPAIALAATLAALAPGVTAPPPAAAQDPTDLEGLVVTAHRRAAPAWTVAAHTTVIEGVELRRAGIEYVADALRRVPGMAVIRSGSFGAVTTVHLRGGESDYVQVLIDGVPVNEPGGAFDFGSLTTDNIERIEIVRGPLSALYGSDAVSGVIQIFTRRGTGPPGGSLFLHAGSFATRRLQGALAGGTDALSYAFSLGRRDTDGIHEYNSGHRQTTLTGRVRGHGPHADATVNVRYEDRRFHTPLNRFGQPIDRAYHTYGDVLTLSVNAGRRWGDALETRFIFNVNDADHGHDIAPDSASSSPRHFAGTNDIRRMSTGGQAIWRSRFGTVLAAGYELEHQSIRAFQLSDAIGSTPYSDNDRRNHAAYTQLSWQLGGVALNGGARMERNERFGSVATWRAGAIWRSSSGRTRLRAAAGTGIKEPTFDEHYANAWFNRGNPDLPPERSTGIEAGVDQELGGGARVSLTWFRQSFRDVIEYRPLGYVNSADARSRGVEAVGVVDAGPVHLAASYTWLDTRVPGPRRYWNLGHAFVPGQPLLRRPRHAAAATTIVRIAETVRLELGLRHTGERLDMPTLLPRDRVTLPAYTVMDLGAEFQVWQARAGRPGFTLTVRAENLTGAEYEEALRFAAPGRAVYAGGRMVVGGGG